MSERWSFTQERPEKGRVAIFDQSLDFMCEAINRSTAQRIVTAYNNHKPLVEALQSARDFKHAEVCMSGHTRDACCVTCVAWTDLLAEIDIDEQGHIERPPLPSRQPDTSKDGIMSDSAYTKIKRRESAVVRQLKDELDGWRFNCERLGLTDRIEFQDWMVATLTGKQLAIMHEMDWYDKKGRDKRDALHDLYMKSRYGPAEEE